MEQQRPSMISRYSGHPKNLQAIGFWRDDREREALASLNPLLAWLGQVIRTETSSDLPMPQDFVDPMWDPVERQRVISYLRAGRRLTFYMGYAHCRFGCGIPDNQMGDADLTDGTFVWPEGFAHYLERHNVRPPESFVRHALRQVGPFFDP